MVEKLGTLTVVGGKKVGIGDWIGFKQCMPASQLWIAFQITGISLQKLKKYLKPSNKTNKYNPRVVQGVK